MHVWTLENWKKEFGISQQKHRSGLRMVFDKGVAPNVKSECKLFAGWLRSEYHFPIRVPIYMKSSEFIKARDGEMISASFLGPDDRVQEPYIRVATGDFDKLKKRYGSEKAMWMIFRSIAHELTHYFQWLNNLSLTPIGEERQATNYSRFVLQEYIDYLNNREKKKPFSKNQRE